MTTHCQATRRGKYLSPALLLHISYDEMCHHRATPGHADNTLNGHQGIYSDPYIGRMGQRAIPSVRLRTLTGDEGLMTVREATPRTIAP
jgi:hypothetical protein